jgi:hypothetical protein
VKTIINLSFVLITLIGVASAQAGTVHVGHTGGYGNYHGNYHGGHGYYAHGGHGTTLTGAKDITPTGDNGTTPLEGTAPVTGAGGTKARPILRQRLLPIELALLYRASDSDFFLFSRLQLASNFPEDIRKSSECLSILLFPS